VETRGDGKKLKERDAVLHVLNGWQRWNCDINDVIRIVSSALLGNNFIKGM